MLLVTRSKSLYINSAYDTKYGAPTAGTPKVFFKYYFANTATGESQEKSSEGANWHSQEQTPSVRKGILIESTRSYVNRSGCCHIFEKYVISFVPAQQE